MTKKSQREIKQTRILKAGEADVSGTRGKNKKRTKDSTVTSKCINRDHLSPSTRRYKHTKTPATEAQRKPTSTQHSRQQKKHTQHKRLKNQHKPADAHAVIGESLELVHSPYRAGSIRRGLVHEQPHAQQQPPGCTFCWPRGFEVVPLELFFFFSAENNMKAGSTKTPRGVKKINS